jgi:hypothetical protein
LHNGEPPRGSSPGAGGNDALPLAAGPCVVCRRSGVADLMQLRLASLSDGTCELECARPFLAATACHPDVRTAKLFTALSPTRDWHLVLSSARPSHPLIFISDKRKNPRWKTWNVRKSINNDTLGSFILTSPQVFRSKTLKNIS